MFDTKADTKTTPSLDRFLDAHLYDYPTTWRHYPSSLPQNSLTFTSSDQMARQLAAHGNSWFGADEMRIFRTRIDNLYNGRFLVFSNRHDYAGATRTYHVMWVYAQPESSHWSTCKLETAFPTLNKARKAASELAAMVAGLDS
jgi:hypothetical protein